MFFRNTHVQGWRWCLVAVPLSLLFASAAIAAPPSQPDAYVPYQGAGARNGQNPDDDGPGMGKPNRIPWNQLTPEQRAFLKPIKGDWDQLPPRRQQRMAGNVERWRQLPPAMQAMTQQRITDSVTHWVQMTPEQRHEAANNLSRFQAMTPADRQRVQQAFQRFQSLTPEQRQMLLQKFRQERQARQRMQGQQQPQR